MKNNQKCVRMSDEVLEYVMKFKGEGFNAKFESMVLHFKHSEPELNRQLAQLQTQIRAKQAGLRKLADKEGRLENTDRYLNMLLEDARNLHARAQRILDE